MFQEPMILTDEPSSDDVQFLEDQINEHNMVRTGRPDFRPVSVFLRDERGSVRFSGHWWAILHPTIGSFRQKRFRRLEVLSPCVVSAAWIAPRCLRSAFCWIGLHIARIDRLVGIRTRWTLDQPTGGWRNEGKQRHSMHVIHSLPARGPQVVDVVDSVPRLGCWTICGPLRRDGARHVRGHVDLHAA
jgi:hypothetical protein